MIIRYLGENDNFALINNKEYQVISVEKGWYRVQGETGDDYLYPLNLFEVLSDTNIKAS